MAQTASKMLQPRLEFAPAKLVVLRSTQGGSSDALCQETCMLGSSAWSFLQLGHGNPRNTQGQIHVAEHFAMPSCLRVKFRRMKYDNSSVAAQELRWLARRWQPEPGKVRWWVMLRKVRSFTICFGLFSFSNSA